MRLYRFAFRVVVANDAEESELLERMRLLRGGLVWGSATPAREEPDAHAQPKW